MPRSQKRRRLTKFRRNPNTGLFLKKFVLMILLAFAFVMIVAGLFLYLSVRNVTKLGKSVNTIVLYYDAITLSKFDPEASETIEVKIPLNLVLDTAGGYGEYQIRNIYKLSNNEKTGDDLFKKSFMKNFSVPVHFVINCSFEKYGQGSTFGKLVGCVRKDNLKNMILLVYSKWVSGENTTTRDLSEYRVITKEASEGGIYTLDDNVFSKLEFDFSQDIELEKVINVELGAGEDSVIPEFFNNIIKLMGGRVVGVVPGANLNSGVECLIVGEDVSFIRNIGSVFGCRMERRKGSGGMMLYFSDEFLRSF